MTTNSMKHKDLYFYLYMAIPLLFPVAYFFTMNNKVACVVFYVVALVCMVFDQKEMVKSANESEPQFAASALGIIIFPPIYVYGRAKAAGVRLGRRWMLFFMYILITLGCTLIAVSMSNDSALKTSACEITTSIFKDKGSDVKCLVVEDMKKVSDKNYRAKAVLNNGVDMPITIEERDDNYIYVTLAPLGGLLE